MILARVFSNIYREGGIILIDSKGQKYICGNPKKNNPRARSLPRASARIYIDGSDLDLWIYWWIGWV